MRRIAIALLLFAWLPSTAPAAADDAFDSLADRTFSEQNMSLFFGLLRQSIIAARDGKPAPEISPETAERLRRLAGDTRTDMLNASLLLLDEMEKDFRRPPATPE